VQRARLKRLRPRQLDFHFVSYVSNGRDRRNVVRSSCQHAVRTPPCKPRFEFSVAGRYTATSIITWSCDARWNSSTTCSPVMWTACSSSTCGGWAVGWLAGLVGPVGWPGWLARLVGCRASSASAWAGLLGPGLSGAGAPCPTPNINCTQSPPLPRHTHMGPSQAGAAAIHIHPHKQTQHTPKQKRKHTLHTP
jgi:hypothetical protein